MHPKLAARQWDVLKERQKTACDTIEAMLLAIDESRHHTPAGRIRALDKVRDAAQTLTTIDDMSPQALKRSAKVTLKLCQAVKLIARLEIERHDEAQRPPAVERRRPRLESA